MIVGGGAILQNLRMTNNLEAMLEKFSGVKICWGVGIEKSDRSANILNSFDFYGSRDWNFKTNYLPCASVMHPLFQKKEKSKKDFLIIDHWKKIPIEIPFEYTRIKNRFISIEDIVTQINNHEYIITSSYHAAYWAILQGKKTIVISNPMLEKFNFKYDITVSDTWDNKFLDVAKVYPSSYEECLSLNTEFLNNLLKSGVFHTRGS
jgi:exopolysaccharide biosynthesis predicted pyruvyltransferase EpsI